MDNESVVDVMRSDRFELASSLGQPSESPTAPSAIHQPRTNRRTTQLIDLGLVALVVGALLFLGLRLLGPSESFTVTEEPSCESIMRRGQSCVLTVRAGDAPVTSLSAGVTPGEARGSWVIDTDCGTSLPAGGECAVEITYSPAAAASAGDSVVVQLAADGGSHEVRLQVQQPAP